MARQLSEILLRVLASTVSGILTKGSVLTHEELDTNIDVLASQFADMGSSIAPYDAAKTYVGGTTYFVSSGGNIWEFISPDDSTGEGAPAENANWTLSSVGRAVMFTILGYDYSSIVAAEDIAITDTLIEALWKLQAQIWANDPLEVWLRVAPIDPTTASYTILKNNLEGVTFSVEGSSNYEYIIAADTGSPFVAGNYIAEVHHEFLGGGGVDNRIEILGPDDTTHLRIGGVQYTPSGAPDAQPWRGFDNNGVIIKLTFFSI